MIEVTDKEARTIEAAVAKVRAKHFDGSDITGEKLGRLANELEGRLNDLGFKVTVDVTPIFRGEGAVVRIDERIDGQNELGVERRMYEVKKRVERGEEAPDIEGHV